MAGTRKILKVGITGGIGSGKSEVCRILENLGVPVLSADEIGRDLSNNDEHLRDSLRTLLGEKTYTSDGVLDRAYVASKIFSNKALQRKINAIIHPRVEEEISRRISQLQKSRTPVVVVEAALIYEAGLDAILDTVVVVDADEENRIARVAKRDGLSRESIVSRMKAQMNPSKTLKKADYSIVNNGTPGELEAKVRFLYTIFQHLSGSGS